MTAPDLIWAALAAALSIAAAILCAWILRGAGLAGGRPAAAVVGGVMGGLILSSAVFGRFAPQWHERIFRGGVEERAALQVAIRQDRAEAAAMRAGHLDPESIDATQAEQIRRRTSLADALTAAMDQRRNAHRIAALIIVAAAAAGAGFASASPRRGERARLRARRLASSPDVLAAAVLFTAIPTAAIFAVLRAFTSIDPPLALAAAAATGAGSMLLTPARWTPRRGRHPAVWTVVAIALTLATAIVLFAATWALLEGRAVSVVAAASVPLAWCAGALAGSCRDRRTRLHRLARDAFLLLLAPAAIAASAAQLDVHALAQTPNLTGWAVLGVLLLAVIAAGDGRWLGAWLGLGLLRKDTAPVSAPDRPMNLATEAIAAGPLLTQGVFASWLFSLGLLDPADPAGALATAALLLAPVLIEPLTGVYRLAVAQLQQSNA